MTITKSQIIAILCKAILATFSTSEWTEIGYLTNTDDYINNHPRLLRSLQWGDDDYKGHALIAIEYILNNSPSNLSVFLQYEPIEKWMRKNDSRSYTEILSEIHGQEVAEVLPLINSETGFEALADAQALLRTRGPISAVDRIHTGLQAYLGQLCTNNGLSVGKNSTANQLLRTLIDNHPSLQKLGARSDDIKRILRTSGAIIDAVGTIRNQASLAHPNENLLTQEEAQLVINISRSIMRFIDGTLTSNNQ